MSGFTSGMRSSNSNEWTTPRDLFDELDAEFHFDLDAASTHENALCETHYTAEEDGLSQPWEGFRTWCNPPYGREIGKWVRKAAETAGGGGSPFSASPPAPTRRGGTTGSWATRRRSGSSGAASSSGTARTRRRSRPRSSCTTGGRAGIGL